MALLTSIIGQPAPGLSAGETTFTDGQVPQWNATQAKFLAGAAVASAAKKIPFSSLPLANGWANFGSGYQTAQFRKRPDGTVEVAAVIAAGTATLGTVMGTLPLPCCPALQKIFGNIAGNVPANNGTTPGQNVGVQTNGGILYEQGGNTFQAIEIAFTVPGLFLTGFGDSIVGGTGASVSANRFLTLLATMLGATEDNQGIGGTLLQNTGAATNNGYDTYVARLRSHYPDYVVILYGINDIDSNISGLSATIYQTQLTAIINDAIAYGVSKSKICVCSPPFVNATMQASGSGAYASPFNLGSTAKILTYSAAGLAAATAAGVKFADIYTAMSNGGGNALVSADGIHPNDGGHLVIANTAYAALMS